MKTMKTISGEVSSIFPELNCFEINSDIFFHGVKASTFSQLRLGKKITVQCEIKNNINKTSKMKKEYNARGERIYEYAINRENAKQDEKNEKIKKHK